MIKSLSILISFLFIAVSVQSQDLAAETINSENVKKLSVPRVGFTFLTTGSSAGLINEINSSSYDESDQKPVFITQYG